MKMAADIKKEFFLYDSEKRRYRATIFGLISGNREPKQTKGLAYVFYLNHQFLFDFLNLGVMREAVYQKTGKRLSEKNITSIEVSAEKYTVEGKKADIVISLREKAGPLLSVIIEAKSVGKGGVNTGELARQIKTGYLADSQFPELRDFKKLGVVLTKYTQYIGGVVSVTWDQIIDLLYKYDDPKNAFDITSQYFYFLTRIGGAMKFYEQEVLSLPAGDTSALIKNIISIAAAGTAEMSVPKNHCSWLSGKEAAPCRLCTN